MKATQEAEQHQGESARGQALRIALANFIATGCYSGYSPWAPGTAGTLTSLVLLFLLYNVFPAADSLFTSISLAVLTCIIGIYSANILCRIQHYGETKDPKQIVVDEFAGYFVAVVGLGADLSVLITAFVWFRIFDIVKPPPIRRIEQLPLGYGIVLDDVVAGIYAAIATRATLLLFSP